MPETGGMYVYLREGWGRSFAFLYGWAQLVLIRAAALGGISSVFGEYFLRGMGQDPAVHPRMADALAAGAIIFAGATNIVGVRLGALFAGISTIAKFGALTLLVLASFAMGGSVGGSFENFASTGAPDRSRAVRPVADLGDVGLRRLRRFDLRSGEVRIRSATCRAIIIGTLLIIFIYLTANAAYLYINPIGVMAKSRLISADTMGALFGRSACRSCR
jgi:amino acid transporter